MNVLWNRERATVGEVVGTLEGPRKPAYNSILTVLRILERKGYVTHEKVGRAFAWVTRIGLGEARRGALTLLLRRFFDDSPELLVLNLLGRDEAHPDDVQRVRDPDRREFGLVRHRRDRWCDGLHRLPASD